MTWGRHGASPTRSRSCTVAALSSEDPRRHFSRSRKRPRRGPSYAAISFYRAARPAQFGLSKRREFIVRDQLASPCTTRLGGAWGLSAGANPAIGGEAVTGSDAPGGAGMVSGAGPASAIRPSGGGAEAGGTRV